MKNIDLTHSSNTSRRSRCVSTPVLSPYSHKVSPSSKRVHEYHQQQQRNDESSLVGYNYQQQHHQSIGKPRSRFSETEDNIICDGVAKGLTWGQISDLLPHRKRATCFNRYRTLQGIRKSRKNSATLLEAGTNDYYSGPVTPPLAPLNTSAHHAPPPLVSPPTKYHCYPSVDGIYSKKNGHQMTTHQDSYPSEISSCSSESSSDEELYYYQQQTPRRTHRASLPAFSCAPLKKHL